MSKFAKVLGIAALAIVINIGAAEAAGHGGYGGWHSGWHGGGWHGGGWGWGGWGWGPYWGADYYDYAPPPSDAVAYCMQRFRSYDPASGTYLGYDGRRHPCP